MAESQRTSKLLQDVRRQAKHSQESLFALKNKLAVWRLEEPPASFDGATSSWCAPGAREANAWQKWVSELERLRGDVQSAGREKRIQAAVVVGGGIGDVLKSSHLLRAIASTFDCDITYVTNQRAAGEIFKNHPYVRRVWIPSYGADEFAEECLKQLPIFDLLVVWRYAVQYWLPATSRIDAKRVSSMTDPAAELRDGFLKYCTPGDVWPRWNYGFSSEMIRLGMRVTDVSAATSSLPLRDSERHSIPFFPHARDLWILRQFGSKPFVTIHHGFDVNNLAKESKETDYISTKNISVDRWREIVGAIQLSGSRSSSSASPPKSEFPESIII